MAAPELNQDPVRSLGASTSRRGLMSRLSAGHIVMIVAGLLAALVNYNLLQQRDVTFPVAVAQSELIPGQLVTASDFRAEEIKATESVLATLLLFEDVAGVEGMIAVRPLRSGQLVGSADFQEPAAPLQQRAMSIPIETDLAVGGAISESDLIDIIHVQDQVARYVAVGVPVLAVAGEETGFGATVDFYVTVAVDADTSLRIASALDEGTVMLIRSTGSDVPEVLTFDPNELPDEAVEAVSPDAEETPGAGTTPTTVGGLWRPSSGWSSPRGIGPNDSTDSPRTTVALVCGRGSCDLRTPWPRNTTSSSSMTSPPFSTSVWFNRSSPPAAR